ncbi:MAG TPA: DUF6567 family protein [Balneolales bacterium]|nr:DUF6567 family protein [Balneolales bacterium]
MIKRIRLGYITILITILVAGCTTTGSFVSTNRTDVELSEANYKIVATNIHGMSEAAYLLGFSYSYGGFSTNTIAVGRVDGTGLLYQEALENLWKNYEDKYGKIDGGKLALVNVRYDNDILNLLLYTSVKVYVRADVIEFTR